MVYDLLPNGKALVRGIFKRITSFEKETDNNEKK